MTEIFMPKDYPLPVETVVRTVDELLSHQGQESLAGLLRNSSASINWKYETVGGTDLYILNLHVPVAAFSGIEPKRDAVEKLLLQKVESAIAKPFKAKLGRRAEKLAEKTIETKDYQYDFRFAWKNNIWHLYEPVSFDLVDPGSIREKANKWLGRGVALHERRRNSKFISCWANRDRLKR
jgi:hypothetical protein